MPRRMYNEYDDMDMEMSEMRRGRGGNTSRSNSGGRGGRSGGQGGNRYPRNERGGRGAYNTYGAYNAYGYSPYSEYEEDEWEDEDEMDMYGAYNEMEMRRGVPGSGRGRRRRRDSRGRFTSEMNMNGGYYDDGPYMNEGRKNQIGFNRGGAQGYQDFDEQELMMMLEEIPDEIPPMESKKWMMELQNEDGSKGEHWNREQTAKVFQEHKVREKTKGEVSEEDFHITMNMLYSDYCKVFKENNINSIKVYVELAIAWLMDKDAAENKLARYFYCVVDSE